MSIFKRIARWWRDRNGIYVTPADHLRYAIAADDFERDPFRIAKLKACEEPFVQ